MTNNGQAASEGYAGSMHPRADLWRSLGARTYGFIAPILANSAWQRGGMLFRRIAGGVIGILGIYFILQPFVTTA